MADENSELVDVTLTVTRILEELGVPYLVGGSMASILYGMVRATNDADLVSELRLDQVEPFARALSPTFYLESESIRDAIKLRSCFNVIHLETMFKVDIYLPKRRPFDQMQMKRRLRRALAANPDTTAYVASPEDTVLAKLEWYRQGDQVSERQWRDVLGVIKALGDSLDRAYLQEWAEALGVSDLLEHAFLAVIDDQ